MTARGITMTDAIQGPPRWHGPDVLLRQTSFRALAEPRRFRDADGGVIDGTLRVRFGEVESRGVALTPKGRRRFDAAMATPDPARVWADYFPASHEHMASAGLAYYHGGDPSKPVVYEDFLPASAAGIFRSNLDTDAKKAAGEEDLGWDYTADWMAGQIGHHDSRPLRALRESRSIMTSVQTSQLPTADDLRAQARDALQAIGSRVELGEPGAHGVHASTPITGDVLFTVAETTPEQADAAIAEAAQAFTTWRTTPAPVRGALVARLGELLVEHKDDLAALVTIEAGKITSEALGEVQEMIDICEFAVGLSRQLYGKTIASERPGHRLMETWHPLGVVGVITAFNFPVAVWSWNAAIALVCGDTLVWKPSELTPLTALACQALVERAAADVGAPDAVTRLIMGGREVGERMVDDPRVALVSATGSVRMGQQVGPRVAQRFGSVLLELGGNNAAIVTPSADLDLAVRGIVFSAAGTAGQRCTTMRRLIVHRSIADTLVERIVSAYRQLPVGDPAADGTLVGPLIHETAYRDMVGALERARAEGGEVFGGDRARPRRQLVLRRTRRGSDARADRADAQRDVRADPLRAHLRRPRRGDRAEQCGAAGSFVSHLHHSTCGRPNASWPPTARTAASPTSTSAPRAPRSVGRSAARSRPAAAASPARMPGRPTCGRATNTVNYSSELPLAQGVHFG